MPKRNGAHFTGGWRPRILPRGRWIAFGLIGVFAFACVAARAQSPAGPITPPPPKVAPAQPAQPHATSKINVEAKLVYLYVAVRDKKGEIVPGLTQQDFSLEEDGRPERITHFVSQSDLPLTLGLLVDTSLSQRNVLDNERDASYKFLDQMLREGKDEAFVIHFDHEVELLQDLTGSRPKLNAALQELQTPQPQFSNRNGGGNSGAGNGNDGGNTSDPDENVPTSNGGRQGDDHARSGGGTLLYDAIYLASNDEMKKQHGRKEVFVLSDGVDRGSKETLASAIEAAQRADTAVYCIYFADQESNRGSGRHGDWGGGHGGGWPGGGSGWPGGGRGGGSGYPQESRTNGKDILKRISSETGGRLFEVSKKLPVDKVFAQIEEELRNQYALGYTPDHSNTGPGFHKIALTMKKNDLTVAAGDGYYSDN